MFYNLNRAPKHWFFSKFAIFCNIFWLETRTMEKTRSCFVRFRLEMTWIVCHNFHLRNRTSVNLKRVLRYWQRHQHTDFFFKICNFLQYFLLGNMQHGKTRSWSVRFHHIPGLAYLDRTAGLGCTVIKFYDISSKKVWRFLAFQIFLTYDLNALKLVRGFSHFQE